MSFSNSWGNSYIPCLWVIIAHRFTWLVKIGKTSNSLKTLWKWLRKHIYQFEKSFDVYRLEKNQLHLLRFAWDVAKILQTCCFGYFGHVWIHTLKVILSSCRNFRVYLQAKNQLHLPCFFWRYCKDMWTFFGYFGHA